MIQYWDRDTVRFMEDAAAYSDFHRQLADRIVGFLPKEGHVCEAGCGLGHLSIELARRCSRVTAADNSEAAIACLKGKALPENLTPVCGDMFQLDEIYDAMVFCYFGRMEDILRIAGRSCRGNVVVAKRNCAAHRFSLKRDTSDLFRSEAEDLLHGYGIPFEKREIRLEFGQPFRTMEDAIRFFRIYDRTGQPVTEEAVRPRLKPVEHPEFSWYLPSLREMNLYVFRGRDIPAAE